MLRYFVNDVECDERDFESQLEDAIRLYVEENYDDMLDDCNEEIHIGSLTFTASQVLKHCDPVAYRCGIDDFIDADLSDREYDFRTEYEEEISGTNFRTEEVEEDD